MIFLKLSNFLILFLIFLVLFVPTSYTALKSFILSILIIFVSVHALTFRNNIFTWKKESIVAFLSLSFVGLFFCAYGIFLGNEGAFRVASVYVIWPLVYFYLTPLLKQQLSFPVLKNILTFSLFFINLYTYIFLLNAANLVPGFLYIELDLEPSVGFYNGFIEYNLYSITSLMFLVPFIIHLSYYKFLSGEFNLYYLLLCFSSILLVFLTGRRALLLILLLIPLVMFFSERFLNIHNRKRRVYSKSNYLILSSILFLIIPLLFYFVSMLNLDVLIIWDVFLNGFQISSDGSPNLRFLQFISLMDSWIESNLLLGLGNGANAELIRDPKMPWAYELTYVYLLFSTGLIGVFFYFSWFFWGIVRLRNALGRNHPYSFIIAPILSGVFGMGLAAISNPYFGKFDYLWIMLLPHLLVDGVLFTRRFKVV